MSESSEKKDVKETNTAKTTNAANTEPTPVDAAPVAIVTGGSRGIGFAIARRLLRDDYRVAIVGTREATAYPETLGQLSPEEQAMSFYVRGPIQDPQAREAIVRETVSHFGRIDVLVNNAGVAPLERRDILEMTEESWDRVLDTNAKGNMFLTQKVARQMIAQPLRVGAKKRGSIVNVSSLSAVVSSPERAEYCVSKAAVSMLTTVYADRLAREDILVHEVRPGVIRTDMTAKVTEKYDALFASGLFPLARWGTPEDIANAVSALVSDDFLYTTGNYIDVDGGFHIPHL